MCLKKSRLYILTYMLIQKDIAQKVANVYARKHREGLTDKQGLWEEICLTIVVKQGNGVS